MGLNLNNPVIVGSSGLTNNIANLREMEKNGAAAVVIKSIFEEQISLEAEKLMKNKDNEKIKEFSAVFANYENASDSEYYEALNYFSSHAKDLTLNDYLKFISDAKSSVSIPVISSINCVSAYNWHYFARKIEEAGADALEINMYILPSNLARSAEENEKVYSDVVEAVKKVVSIPVSLKLGFYFSSLVNSIVNISKTGVDGLVLFNRPYTPDIDIDKFEFNAGNITSHEYDYAQSLRWVGILSGKLHCDIAAATGIHDETAVIKQLLAGATSVQITSTLYNNGYGQIKKILEGINSWMKDKNFNTIDDFRGKMSQNNIDNPAAYERVQFMKLYSKIE